LVIMHVCTTPVAPPATNGFLTGTRSRLHATRGGEHTHRDRAAGRETGPGTKGLDHGHRPQDLQACPRSPSPSLPPRHLARHCSSSSWSLSRSRHAVGQQSLRSRTRTATLGWVSWAVGRVLRGSRVACSCPLRPGPRQQPVTPHRVVDASALCALRRSATSRSALRSRASLRGGGVHHQGACAHACSLRCGRAHFTATPLAPALPPCAPAPALLTASDPSASPRHVSLASPATPAMSADSAIAKYARMRKHPFLFEPWPTDVFDPKFLELIQVLHAPLPLACAPPPRCFLVRKRRRVVVSRRVYLRPRLSRQ